MSTVLYTIGYEGADIVDFIRTLKNCGVERLIDIRDVPISRKRGFSKTALANALQEHGISYSHLKALGDPKAGREAMRRGDYSAFLEIYTSHLERPEGKSSLLQAVELAQNNTSVLLCYERSPAQCHRSVVAREMKLISNFELRNVGVNA